MVEKVTSPVPDTKAQAVDSPALPARTPAAAVTKPVVLHKTTGERRYDVLQFLTGKAFIVAISAVIAYEARYGRDKYGPVPNYLKKFQTSFHEFLDKKLGKTEAGKYIAGAAASTTLTMWGGNLFAPFLKAFENNKEKIANHYNRKYGNPGEVEIAHERLKDDPKQSWGDIVKGRLAGWVVVCSAFIGGDLAMGKSKKTGMHRLAEFEEKFGRWAAGFTKAGKDMSKKPLTEGLTEAEKQLKSYKIGKIVALDLFATSAAIIIWNSISRMSAKKRKKSEETVVDDMQVALNIPSTFSDAQVVNAPTTTHSVTIQPRTQAGYAKMANESQPAIAHSI